MVPSKWCADPPGLAGLECADGVACDGKRCQGERVAKNGNSEETVTQRRKVWLRGHGWSPVVGRRKKQPGRMT